MVEKKEQQAFNGPRTVNIDTGEIYSGEVSGRKLADQQSEIQHADNLSVAVFETNNRKPETVDYADTVNSINAGPFRDEDCVSIMRMCYAAKCGDTERLSLLLRNRARINATDYAERTALHVAVAMNQHSAVDFLLEHRADPNLMDLAGQTPLSEAERSQSFEIEEVLKTAGAYHRKKSLSVAAKEQYWALNQADVQMGDKLSDTLKSEVYKATWRGIEVVAKIAKTDEDTDPIAQKRELLHEIKMLSTIRHPDLVLFLGACLDDQIMFITEFMPGGDLERYYMRKRLETQAIWRPKAPQLLRWCLDVSHALCFLHKCQPPIVHRDLKPLNLLLNDTCTRLKVSDFGISVMRKPKPVPASSNRRPFLLSDPLDVKTNSYNRRSDSSRVKPPVYTQKNNPARGSQASLDCDYHKMTGGVGSWHYMAPEVVRNEQYNEKADIYAFGLIMFFMSAGRDPFYENGPDVEWVLEAYLRGEEPRPKVLDCTPLLRSVMCEAWHADPKNRPSANELIDILRGVNVSGQCGCTIG